MNKDIFNRDLEEGDIVLYARKRNYQVNGELVRCKIINIASTFIFIQHLDSDGIYKSTNPKTQIYKLM